MFIGHGDKVCKARLSARTAATTTSTSTSSGQKLTNLGGSSGAEEALTLVPPRRMSMEDMMSYIKDDELVEVTPKGLRLRKRFLTPHARELARKQERSAKEKRRSTEILNISA